MVKKKPTIETPLFDAPWPEDGSDDDPRWNGPLGKAILDSIAGNPTLTVMQKEIAPTSREAFAKQLKRIPHRWLRILKYVRENQDRNRTFTSMELVKNLGETDVNNVRPELTRLKTAELLVTGTKRVCSHTQQRVFTWMITELGRAHLEDYDRR